VIQYTIDLPVIYWDRKANIWDIEKTKVTDVIEHVRLRKWTWAGHVSRIPDNRWTSPINISKPYEGKQPSVRQVR
jgi:hypothetical protein